MSSEAHDTTFQKTSIKRSVNKRHTNNMPSDEARTKYKETTLKRTRPDTKLKRHVEQRH